MKITNGSPQSNIKDCTNYYLSINIFPSNRNNLNANVNSQNNILYKNNI